MQRWARIGLIVLLMCSVLSIALSSGAAAADPTVTRNGTDLVITPEDSNSDATSVEVVADQPGFFGLNPLDKGLTYTGTKESSSGSFIIDTSNPNKGEVVDKRLTLVNVDLKYNGTETGANVSLHSVEPKETIPVWTSSDALYIRTDGPNTYGLTDRTNVQVEFESGPGIVYGEYQKEKSRIKINRSELPPVDELSQNSLRIISHNGGTISQIDFTTELRSTGDQLVLWNPLIKANTEYSVTAGGEKQSVETAYAGVIPVSSTDSPSELRVAVSKDGRRLFNSTLPVQSPQDISATFDGKSVQLAPSLDSLPMQSALVKAEGDIATVPNERIQGAMIDYSASSPPDVVLVSAPTGLMSISTFSPPERIDIMNVGLFVLFALVLGLIGVVVGLVGGSLWSANSIAYLSSPFFSLGVCTVGAIGILVWRDVNVVGLTYTNISVYVGTLLGPVGTLFGLYIINTYIKDEATQDSVGRTSGVQRGQNHQNMGFNADITVRGSYEVLEGKRADNNSWEEINQNEYVMADEMKVRAVNPEGDVSGTKTVSKQNQGALLRLPVYKTIDVRSTESGFVVDNVDISGVSQSTEVEGNRVKIPAREDSIDIELSRRKFHRETVTIGRNDGENGVISVEIEPKKGEVEIITKVDGVLSPNTTVLVKPDGDTAEFIGSETVSTDQSGRVLVEKMVGSYTITHGNSSTEADYSVQDRSITVRYNDKTTVDIDVEFTYQLPTTHRERIDELRAEIESLSDSSYDTAIQTYFGSVPNALLSAVESIPDHGELFFDNDYSPNETAESLLNTSSELIELVTQAMNTKRNIDLFTACGDMAESNITWSDSDILESLMEYMTQRSGQPDRDMRKNVKQHYEEVDELISDERQQVSEISPVKEIHNQIIKLLGSGDTDKEQIAAAFATQRMLDAIEEFFEHEALRKRLSRTVF